MLIIVVIGAVLLSHVATKMKTNVPPPGQFSDIGTAATETHKWEVPEDRIPTFTPAGQISAMKKTLPFQLVGMDRPDPQVSVIRRTTEPTPMVGIASLLTVQRFYNGDIT